MYSCVFVKYLWKDKEKKRRFKVLEKRLSLAFAPTQGLEVCEGEWFSGTIERVVWDNVASVFSLKVTDIVPKKGISAELLYDVAIKQGWQESGSKDNGEDKSKLEK